MVRDLVLDAQVAKPAVGEVHLDLAAQRPLRADREHVPDNEHPDHEHRIDRGPADRGIVTRKLGVHPRQIQNRIDLAHQMIGRNNVIEMERIEQLALIALLPPHHRQPPPLNVVPGRNHCSQPTATDFYNKIGTSLPFLRCSDFVPNRGVNGHSVESGCADIWPSLVLAEGYTNYGRRRATTKSSPREPKRAACLSSEDTALPVRPLLAASLGTRSCTWAASSDSAIWPSPLRSPLR